METMMLPLNDFRQMANEMEQKSLEVWMSLGGDRKSFIWHGVASGIVPDPRYTKRSGEIVRFEDDMFEFRNLTDDEIEEKVRRKWEMVKAEAQADLNFDSFHHDGEFH